MHYNRLLTIGFCLLLLRGGIAKAEPPSPDQVLETRARCGASSAPAAAWHHLLLSGEKEASGDLSGAAMELRTAARLDPELLDAHTAMVRLGIPRDLGLAGDGIAGASAAIAKSYLVQRRVFAALIPGIWIAVMLTVAAAWIFIALRHLPAVHHIVAESLGRSRGRRAPWLAACALAVPLFLPWGLVAAAGFFAALVLREMKGHEKAVAGFGALWILLAPAVWHALTPYAAPPDPREPGWLVERAQREIPTPEIHRLVEDSSAPDPSTLSFARGMILRREGKLNEAASAFDAASRGPGLATAQAGVNLANVYFWRGDATAAARRYEALLDRESVRLEARYNLAVALSRLHRFNEADARLEEAARLDLDRVRSAGRPGDPRATHDVMDGVISISDLWSIQRTAARTTTSPLPVWSSVLFPGGRHRAVSLVLLGAAAAGLLGGSALRRRLRVHACHHCGAPVCRRCVARTAGYAYCSQCAESLGGIAPVDQRRILLRRWSGQDFTQAQRTRIWAVNLMPGGGLILRGKPVSGTILLGLFCAGFLLWSRAVWPFTPIPTTSGVETILRGGGSIVLFVSWALSVELARREARRRDLRTFFERDLYRAAA